MTISFKKYTEKGFIVSFSDFKGTKTLFDDVKKLMLVSASLFDNIEKIDTVRIVTINNFIVDIEVIVKDMSYVKTTKTLIFETAFQMGLKIEIVRGGNYDL